VVVWYALASVASDCDVSWKEVHGIEISSLIHDDAVNVVRNGAEQNIFSPPSDDLNSIQIHLHEAPASEMKEILFQADIIFCYSTVFDSKGFNVDIGAMILAKEWSQLLADSCKSGAGVMALNPDNEWTLKYILEVENPSLLGSTSYISIRE